VLDSTGVGNAVADIFDAAQLPHVRILITAGNETTGHGTWQRQQWHVPKTDLISIVDAWLHTGVLRFSAALSEAPAMRGIGVLMHTAADEPESQARLAAFMQGSFPLSPACLQSAGLFFIRPL
jgi:hypothetical protein